MRNVYLKALELFLVNINTHPFENNTYLSTRRKNKGNSRESFFEIGVKAENDRRYFAT